MLAAKKKKNKEGGRVYKPKKSPSELCEDQDGSRPFKHAHKPSRKERAIVFIDPLCIAC